jgi:hypothetical protein
VYLDKDLVLPPMGSSGAAETFYVLASTDLQRSGIMTTRIREQLEKIPDIRAKCAISISTLPVALRHMPDQLLDQQVQSVATTVSEMVLASMERKHSAAEKNIQPFN